MTFNLLHLIFSKQRRPEVLLKKSEQEVTMSVAGDPRKPTVFVLAVPGGAVLDIIPAMILARIEDLAEEPILDLFHATDAVSGGTNITAALNIPRPDDPTRSKYSMKFIVEQLCTKAPEFFPEKKDRIMKMITSQLLHVSQIFLDPAVSDSLLLDDIRGLCDELKNTAPSDIHSTVDQLQLYATQRWLTRGSRKKTYELCDQIRAAHPQLKSLAGAILTRVYDRSHTGHLNMAFRRAALGIGSFIIRNWATNFLYDALPMKKTYEEVFGTVRMGDSVRSNYISAHNAITNRKFTFFCRKKDIFNLRATENAAVSQHNHMITDAVMASSAHPLALPPHETEDGNMLCTDAATWHTPLRCVLDVARSSQEKYPDANVKLVILGTGDALTKTHHKSEVLASMTKLGVAGNLITGNQLEQIQGYTMSDAIEILRQQLGDEDIIEINPRLKPQTSQEVEDFPSRDILNTSLENITKVRQSGQRTLIEKDFMIRQLAQMLVDNLHLLGYMTDEKHDRITTKIQTSSPPSMDPGNGKSIEDIFERARPSRRGSKVTIWFGQVMMLMGAGMHVAAANDNDIAAKERSLNKDFYKDHPTEKKNGPPPPSL